MRERAIESYSVMGKVRAKWESVRSLPLGLKGVEEEREKDGRSGRWSRKWNALRFCFRGSSGNLNGQRKEGKKNSEQVLGTSGGPAGAKEWGSTSRATQLGDLKEKRDGEARARTGSPGIETGNWRALTFCFLRFINWRGRGETRIDGGCDSRTVDGRLASGAGNRLLRRTDGRTRTRTRMRTNCGDDDDEAWERRKNKKKRRGKELERNEGEGSRALKTKPENKYCDWIPGWAGVCERECVCVSASRNGCQ